MSFSFLIQSQFDHLTNPKLFNRIKRENQLGNSFISTTSIYIIAIINDIEVGVAQIEFNENNNQKHIGHLKNLFVMDEWQSRGAFEALLIEVIQVANDYNLVKIWCQLPSQSKSKTIILAQNVGFKIICQQSKAIFWNNVFYDTTMLVKII